MTTEPRTAIEALNAGWRVSKRNLAMTPDPRPEILAAGDRLVAMMLVANLMCDAKDLQEMLQGIRDDMEDEMEKTG